MLLLEGNHRPRRLLHKAGDRIIAPPQLGLDRLRLKPQLMRHVEGDHRHIGLGLNQVVEGVRIGKTVKLANRGDIARPRQGTPHDQDSSGLFEYARLLLFDQRQVGQRPRGDDHHLAGAVLETGD